MNLPMVSCLCVTRSKVNFLRRAINSFLNQTYSNKELVILYDEDDIATRNYLKTIKNDIVKCLEIPSNPKMSLGNLRNLSVDFAYGDYICQWDDDDWYHEDRIEIQMKCILKSHKNACFLAYWFMFDMTKKRAFLSPVGPWPGSMICKKDILSASIRYSDIKRHEDFEVMKSLIVKKCAIPVIMPSLYIYVYHGNNTFDKGHFDALFSRSQVLPCHVNDLFNKIFDEEISHAEASRLLMSAEILSSIDYFHFGIGGVNG
jgi:glycosyltransferase involved in cell wall biosynthesis